MADMGFLPQVRRILDQTPSDGQRLLFSATLDGDVAALVQRYLTDPVTRSIAPPNGAVVTMEHHLLHVDDLAKGRVIAEIAARDGPHDHVRPHEHGADRLVKQLRPGRRRRRGAARRQGPERPQPGDRGVPRRHAPVLIATDVAARGIHVNDVSLVVHVDPPADPKATCTVPGARRGRASRAPSSRWSRRRSGTRWTR